MATWGDRLPYLGRGRIGSGVQVPPEAVPTPKVIHYGGFRNGLMLSDRPGDVPEGFFSKALDCESTRDDGVVRALPITRINLERFWLDHLFVHPSLDFQSELIAIAEPHEGYYTGYHFGIRQGADFVWYDLPDGSLDATVGRHWVYTNYGDTLIFTNGRKSYYRKQDGGILFASNNDMPAGETVFVAFGRLFFGGTLVNGEYNLLALGWNGTGDFDDWSSLDAGFELLLSDTNQADKIVAGRMLSYDTVAILCRRTIWIGLRTGVSYRPLEPQLRLAGIGCVFEQSAHTTESGVTFLSDEGVRHFDGQRAEIISGPINAELLPLSYEDIQSYKAAWDGGRRRYILCTPCSTFVYQFPTSEWPQGAWFKKTMAFTNIIPFADQVDDPTWDDFGDKTWDDLGDLTWLDLATTETNAAPDILYVSGAAYGVEDLAGDGYLGLVQSGVAELRPAEGQAAIDFTHELHEVKGYLVEHRGGGDIEILARDESGAYRIKTPVTLPSAVRTKTTRVEALYSIRAVGIAVRILSTDLEIRSIKQIVQSSGQALGDMITEDDDLLSETATEVFSESDTLVFWR